MWPDLSTLTSLCMLTLTLTLLALYCKIKCMQRLYELGARRVMVTGTGPLGCVPAEIAQRGRNGECAADLQQASDLFNPQLVQLLNELNTEIGSDVYISANAFAMNMDFISNPQAYGMSTFLYFCSIDLNIIASCVLIPKI